MKRTIVNAVIGGLWCSIVVFHAAAAGEPQSARVSLTVSGLGTVVSEPPGISCPGTCDAEFPAFSDVQLHARPDKGQRLIAWAGDCDSPESSCRLYMDGEKIVQTAFSADF